MPEIDVLEIGSHKEQILRAYSKALEREAHVLTFHPDLLWQQLHNRVQWENLNVRYI